MLRSLGFLIVLILGLSFSTVVNAAVICLTTGEHIMGRIIEKTDTYVVVDLHGLPSTYYIGEIQTIDGKEIDLPAPPPVTESQTSDIPNYGDEEQSLTNFMNARAAQAATIAPAATASAATTSVAVTPPAAPAVASTDSDQLPTLQQFLQSTVGSLFTKSPVPTAPAVTTSAATTPAVTAPAATTPVAIVPAVPVSAPTVPAAIAAAATTPVVTAPVAPTPAVAPTPVSTSSDQPPTLQQFLTSMVEFLQSMVGSVFTTLKKM